MLEPAFRWARGDESIGFSTAVVCSNCDHLKFYIDDRLVAELDPDRNEFGNLPHPPFVLHVKPFRNPWGDLRIEGYIQGKQVIVKRCSGKGIDQKFSVLPDDTKLVAEIIGDNPFALIGGTGAVWLRTKEQAGTARLTAVHPVLGERQIDFEIIPAAPEGI